MEATGKLSPPPCVRWVYKGLGNGRGRATPCEVMFAVAASFPLDLVSQRNPFDGPQKMNQRDKRTRSESAPVARLMDWVLSVWSPSPRKCNVWRRTQTHNVMCFDSVRARPPFWEQLTRAFHRMVPQ